MLQAGERDRLLEATVLVVDDVRRSYLRTPGASVLKHWDQIQDRVRMAARTSSSADEWITNLSRSLKLPAPDKWLSTSARALQQTVTEMHATRDWLDLVEREYTLIMAKVRLRAETRQQARRDAEEAAQ